MPAWIQACFLFLIFMPSSLGDPDEIRLFQKEFRPYQSPATTAPRMLFCFQIVCVS